MKWQNISQLALPHWSLLRSLAHVHDTFLINPASALGDWRSFAFQIAFEHVDTVVATPNNKFHLVLV